MSLLNRNKLDDFLLFNFLAKDKQNAEDIVTAGDGFVVPGIVSSDFEQIEDGVRKVRELQTVTEVVSIGLGGNGNPGNWKKVMEIAAKSQAGHINQPFERTVFTKGYLQAKGIEPLINGLVIPTGEIGFVKLTSGLTLRVEELMDLAKEMGIQSIKFMPLKGTEHLDELVYLCQIAADRGIHGVEPAGGIDAGNIAEIVESVRKTGISFFMPHIFGSAIDKETGATIPKQVMEIIQKVRR